MTRGRDQASAVVLAGGLSRRLGRDKRRLRLWGEGAPTLLEHPVSVVGALCADVVVVLNDPDEWPGLPARLVGDRFPDAGALGGIWAGLDAAREQYALVVACDMPLLSAPLLAAMLARPRDYDALVPRSPRPAETRNPLGLEPLHAVYARSCMGPIARALGSGRRQVAALFPQLRMAYVEPEEIRRYDPAGRSLLSVNTPDQIVEAQALLAAGGRAR